MLIWFDDEGEAFKYRDRVFTSLIVLALEEGGKLLDEMGVRKFIIILKR